MERRTPNSGLGRLAFSSFGEDSGISSLTFGGNSHHQEMPKWPDLTAPPNDTQRKEVSSKMALLFLAARHCKHYKAGWVGGEKNTLVIVSNYGQFSKILELANILTRVHQKILLNSLLTKRQSENQPFSWPVFPYPDCARRGTMPVKFSFYCL